MGSLPLLTAALLSTGATPYVEITLQQIEASNEPGSGGAESRAIRDLAATLNYKSYRTLDQSISGGAFNQPSSLPLRNGATLRITPRRAEGAARKLRLQINIQHGERYLDTDFSVRDGGTVFVSAGPIGKDALVLAISARLK